MSDHPQSRRNRKPESRRHRAGLQDTLLRIEELSLSSATGGPLKKTILTEMPAVQHAAEHHTGSPGAFNQADHHLPADAPRTPSSCDDVDNDSSNRDPDIEIARGLGARLELGSDALEEGREVGSVPGIVTQVIAPVCVGFGTLTQNLRALLTPWSSVVNMPAQPSGAPYVWSEPTANRPRAPSMDARLSGARADQCTGALSAPSPRSTVRSFFACQSHPYCSAVPCLSIGPVLSRSVHWVARKGAFQLDTSRRATSSASPSGIGFPYRTHHRTLRGRHGLVRDEGSTAYHWGRDTSMGHITFMFGAGVVSVENMSKRLLLAACAGDGENDCTARGGGNEVGMAGVMVAAEKNVLLAGAADGAVWKSSKSSKSSAPAWRGSPTTIVAT
ncbi:hypothetical protein LXA43DRAFT_1064980 [Ganoderma leucocontextum]|nr:hypothetical protein LXA43DRAFT_1064980 [Ganoderma leucocontextum]